MVLGSFRLWRLKRGSITPESHILKNESKRYKNKSVVSVALFGSLVCLLAGEERSLSLNYGDVDYYLPDLWSVFPISGPHHCFTKYFYGSSSLERICLS